MIEIKVQILWCMAVLLL